MPEEVKSFHLCELALDNNPDAIQFVSDKYITELLLLTLVKRKGRVLAHIHKSYKTSELCREAVKNGLWAISSVPSDINRADLKCLISLVLPTVVI
ncbi:hypothetical protein [Photobacterium profundum]|uniref:hypothetical protein n=1 Tax=Photobacterium profundum TaxID=74109 RepID=UPI003D103C6E